MILLLFFFWADLSQWGQKQKKEINSQGLIKMFITQKLVNLTPSGQIQVTHELIIPLIIPSPFFQDFHDFSSFLISENWASNENFDSMHVRVWARIGFQQSWADGHDKNLPDSAYESHSTSEAQTLFVWRKVMDLIQDMLISLCMIFQKCHRNAKKGFLIWWSLMRNWF